MLSWLNFSILCQNPSNPSANCPNPGTYPSNPGANAAHPSAGRTNPSTNAPNLGPDGPNPNTNRPNPSTDGPNRSAEKRHPRSRFQSPSFTQLLTYSFTQAHSPPRQPPHVRRDYPRRLQPRPRPLRPGCRLTSRAPRAGRPHRCAGPPAPARLAHRQKQRRQKVRLCRHAHQSRPQSPALHRRRRNSRRPLRPRHSAARPHPASRGRPLGRLPQPEARYRPARRGQRHPHRRHRPRPGPCRPRPACKSCATPSAPSAAAKTNPPSKSAKAKPPAWPSKSSSLSSPPSSKTASTAASANTPAPPPTSINASPKHARLSIGRGVGRVAGMEKRRKRSVRPSC